MTQTLFNHEEAISAVVAGETMASVARRYRVSRERIRQIVRAASAIPPSGRDVRRGLRDQVSELVFEGYDDAAIAEMLGITPGGAKIDRQLLGLSECGWRERRLKYLQDGVDAGKSLRRLAIDAGLNPGPVQSFARRFGIKSKHGPHRDLSYRSELFAQWRRELYLWAEIDGLLSTYEGRPNYRGAAYLWAAKHAPHLTFVGRRSRQSFSMAAE